MGLVTSSVDQNGVAKLTLNDETNLNAMSEEMAAEFSAAVAGIKAKRAARVLIITGAGKAFSAGGHLEMLEKKRLLSGEENRAEMLKFYDSFLSILDLRIPLIAALNGAAVGAGLCLACACDIRIASTDAKLGFTFLKLGLHPGMGGTYFLPRIIGPSAAAELLMTGRIISAEEAFRIGLVSKVCQRAALLSEVDTIANEILACGPQATAQLVETMRGDGAHLDSALAREAVCQSVNYGSAEFAEGITAIKERRSPIFPKG
jgi:enoyl-CoA hydratase/carnithine racemase